MDAAARDGAIDIAIIGSGIAGLAAARRLADAGRSPVIFDKGRGIGGRVATRRSGGFQFDHGAQCVTARAPAFAAGLAELCARDAAAPWIGQGKGDRIVGLPSLASACITLQAAGDWCLGPRVEDAWTSGRAAADALLGTRA